MKKEAESPSSVPNQQSLPILEYEEEIKSLIRNNTVGIIIGNTGSGKTTEIGRMMSEIVSGKIATTQPRRPAAVTVADYVAKKQGGVVGEKVGYHVRFNDTTNRGTTLDYVTDGILIEQMLADPLLLEYSGVILDEAHIRNLNVDFLMGLILQLNEKREERNITLLKILITSATIPGKQFSEFFNMAPILEIPGRMFPVEIVYLDKEPDDYLNAISKKVTEVLRTGVEGDILIFVPGEREIREIVSRLEKQRQEDIEILPFFGQQSLAEQDKVFLKYSRRKVVIATNIAETSLTIDGVKVVIDSGLQRASIFDHRTGISRLEDEPASKAAIDQRKGRAGRTAPGRCYRMYTHNTPRPAYDIAEIMRTDLSGMVLKMKRLGIKDILNFKFIDQPDIKQLKKAIYTLKILGALDDKEEITTIGRVMSHLPLDPHIGRMVVEADKFGCVDAICTVAAFMSSKSVFDRTSSQGELAEIEQIHRSFKVNSKGEPLSDPEVFLRIWDKFNQLGKSESWVAANFFNPRVLNEIDLIRDDLIETLRRHGVITSLSRDSVAIAKAVIAGHIDNLLEKIGMEEYHRLHGQGDEITIHPSSALKLLYKPPRFIVAGEIMTNAMGYTGAFQCQEVKLDWLPEVGMQILRKEEYPIRYGQKNGKKLAFYRYYLKNDGRHLLTASEPVSSDLDGKSSNRKTKRKATNKQKYPRNKPEIDV